MSDRDAEYNLYGMHAMPQRQLSIGEELGLKIGGDIQKALETVVARKRAETKAIYDFTEPEREYINKRFVEPARQFAHSPFFRNMANAAIKTAPYAFGVLPGTVSAIVKSLNTDYQPPFAVIPH